MAMSASHHLGHSKNVRHVCWPDPAEHRIESYVAFGKIRMSSQPILSRSDDPSFVSRGNDTAPPHLNEGQPITLQRHERDSAYGRWVLTRDDPLPIHTQDKTSNHSPNAGHLKETGFKYLMFHTLSYRRSAVSEGTDLSELWLV
jgi:hypothetical protein